MRQLRKRNVNIDGLYTAEQAVLYALLGDSKLSAERLGWILESLSESSLEDQLKSFVKVASESLRRNRECKAFENCERLFSKWKNYTNGSDDDKQPIFSAMHEVEAQAKGELLARRITKGCAVPEQRRVDDVGWGCVMLWAAYFIEKEGGNKAFWANVNEYAGSDAVWSVPAHIMCRLCDQDVCVMDRYLSKLLDALKEGKGQAGEAGDRIRLLTKCKGYVAFFFKAVFRNLGDDTFDGLERRKVTDFQL